MGRDLPFWQSLLFSFSLTVHLVSTCLLTHLVSFPDALHSASTSLHFPSLIPLLLPSFGCKRVQFPPGDCSCSADGRRSPALPKLGARQQSLLLLCACISRVCSPKMSPRAQETNSRNLGSIQPLSSWQSSSSNKLSHMSFNILWITLASFCGTGGSSHHLPSQTQWK